MAIRKHLAQQMIEILTKLEKPMHTYGNIDTRIILYDLASNDIWNITELKRVDFLSKRVDISKKLFLGYFSKGRRATDIEVTDQTCLEILIAILLKTVYLVKENAKFGIRLKRFNTLLKALDIYTPK